MARCTECGRAIGQQAGKWWDGHGWQGDAVDGRPWHLHTPWPPVEVVVDDLMQLREELQ